MKIQWYFRPAKIWRSLFLYLLILPVLAAAQTTVLLPMAPAPYFDPLTGQPLANGSLAFYASGSFTQQAIFTDSTGQTQLSNPVALNAAGFPINASGALTTIWLTPGIAYRIVGKSSQNVQRFLQDGVTGLASSQATLSTVVPFASTMTFSACANNQLFFVTLTGNVNGSSFNECPGIQLPAFVTFELIQDGTGGRTFNWPANSFGGGTLNPTANTTTIQPFLWDGTTLQALSPSMGAGVFLPPSVETQTLQLGPGSSIFYLGTVGHPLIESGFAPDVFIGSGFGTSPSIVNSNGTAVFEVNVGTGGVATSGVISFAKPATNGWGCQATDMNTNIVTRETAFTTTSATFTAASAWTASDKLLINCMAF